LERGRDQLSFPSNGDLDLDLESRKGLPSEEGLDLDLQEVLILAPEREAAVLAHQMMVQDLVQQGRAQDLTEQ